MYYDRYPLKPLFIVENGLQKQMKSIYPKAKKLMMKDILNIIENILKH